MDWTVDQDDLDRFIRGVEGDPSSEAWFDLRRDAETLALRPGFDRLITLDHNTIKELPHQIKVAEQALRRPMGGRALLADEVGLGKTIEAGIILKELAVRGLARRVLVLCPAALVEQWQSELETKFFERFSLPVNPEDWERMPRAIASHGRARGRRHRPEILKERWDLLIVDEAHKARRHGTALYKLLTQIERNFTLLLTATPLQNDLRELYNLVTLLRPGQLGTWREFRERHMVRGDARRAAHPDALRELTAEVMIRTRRSSVADAVRLPPRVPRHPEVILTDAEQSLYVATVQFLRELYRDGFYQSKRQDGRRKKRYTGRGIQSLERIRLCRRLCSSSHALGSSLRKLAEGEDILPAFRNRALDLADRCRQVPEHAKLDRLLELLEEIPDRVLVFTEHLPTIRLIVRRVREIGRPVLEFSGKVGRATRSRRLAKFKQLEDSVFVATRAGTEGLNLQFCNQLVNYELPWNPMIVEQRIGRIHRIGQTRDAFIYNLAARGTIEDRVLELLNEKIRLFELVVGELDVILGEFGGSDTLEKRLVEAWVGADDDDAFDVEFAKIGLEVEQSRESGKEQEGRNSELGADDAAMRLEREFSALTIPARVRLGFGTRHLLEPRGIEAKRHRLGLHVVEILDMLGSGPVVEIAGHHPEYGPLRRIVGLTGRQRAIELIVQGEKLPMILVDLSADAGEPMAAAV